MRRLLFMLCIILASHSYGQSIMWEKKFDAGQVHMVINQTNDSALIVSGSSNVTGFYPAHIVKFNQNGVTLWQKNIPGLYTGEQDILQTQDESYIFTGAKRITPPHNYSDILVRKLNPVGDTVWNKVYTTAEGDIPTSIVNNSDNSFIIYGVINNTGLGNYFLRKVDSLGNTIWYKQYEFTWHGYSANLIVNRYGNFVLSGMRGTQVFQSFHPYLMEVDQQGDTINTKLLIVKGDEKDERVYRIFNNIIQTTDGGYAFSGYIDSSNIKTGFIVKTDSAFNKKWFFLQPAPINKSQNITKVAELSDSTFVLLSNEENASSNKIIITKVSKTGQLITKHQLNAFWCSKIRLYDWEFLPDSSVVVVGGCLDTPHKAYMARVGNVGIPAVVPPLPVDTTDTTTAALPPLPQQQATLGQSSPNPASTVATVPYSLPAGVTSASIQVHDMVTSAKLQEVKIRAQEGKGSAAINLQQLSSGFYLYILMVDGKPVSTKKMVVIK